MGVSTKLSMILTAKGAKRVAADIDNVDGKVKKLDRDTKAVEKSSGRVAGRWKSLGSAARVGAAGVAFLGLKLGKDALAEYREAYKVGRQTNAVIEATGGVAGISAKHVGDLAESVSNKTAIDDEEIQKSANMLLTFKAIRNEVGKNNQVFDRATAAAVDLSASGFGSVKSASTMLGKALNDPLKGMTALNKVGVTFTDGQKDQIKKLVETGDVLGAQKVIMKEVESQVKGSAAAQADPVDRLTVTWANLLETIGTKFAPVLQKVISFMLDDGIPAISAVGRFLDRTKGILIPLVAVVGTAIAAYRIYTAVANAMKAAQIGLNIAMSMNPIGLIVAAIAALVIGLFILYKRSETFRNIVNGIGRTVSTVFKGIVGAVGRAISFIREHWKTILMILTGPIGAAVILIASNFNRIVRFAKNLPGRVTRALSGLWDGIKNTFKSALNWIIGKWNSFNLSIGPIKIPAAPDIPKISINTPNIPLFAAGGEAKGVGARWISGEAGPEIGEVTSSGVRITPLGDGGSSAGEMVIHLDVNLDGRKVGQGVRRVALRDLLASA